MALLHDNKYEWVITEVYYDGMVALKCPHSGVREDHLLFEVTDDTLFPNLTVLRAYARLMGLEIE
jgi:hypothetical protein